MLDKIVSLAMSVASRGLNNTKADLLTKKLRAVSCFGHKEILACEFLKKSQYGEMHYCGKCGCGDFPHTWLLKNNQNYSKLDYPKLNCPLQMPGFTNYDPNVVSERKTLIEKMPEEELNFVEVTINGAANQT